MSVIERNRGVTFHYRLGLADTQVIEDNFDDETLTGPISEFDEVEVDLIHPLAGQIIRYSVKMIAVENCPFIIH